MSWHASIATIMPEMFPGPLGHSMSGRALERDVWSLSTTDIRDFSSNKHRSVDDTPAGGGAGMVMRADIVANAVDAASARVPDAPCIYLSPRGTPLTQKMAHEFAAGPGIVLLCGRFEGVDQRVIDDRGLREVSVGDYVLSGGEIAALVLLDAIVRLLPGVIGTADSLTEESFENDLLEYPQYTRPREWAGQAIPEVLLSGDHKRIAEWRRAQSEALTRARRPDLIEKKKGTPDA